jgi:putative transcriptional regulator
MTKYRINNSIRKLRFFQNEMTQQQLADKVGVTRQTIIAMEQGKYSPSLELAFRVALAFSVPLDEVFSYEPETDST